MNESGKRGIGWSNEGIEEYNRLFDIVIRDRKARNMAFVDELCKVRKLELNTTPEHGTHINSKPIKHKVVAKNCFSYMDVEMSGFNEEPDWSNQYDAIDAVEL